jgi:uncharacterized protein YqcC (DUF446 family)
MNNTQATASPQRETAQAQVATLLDALTATLQGAGQWQAAAPPPSAFASQLPFCCDTLRFTEWLQWLFIPRTRALLDAGRPLPSASGIAPMAEEALQGCDWDTTELIHLLQRFDRLVTASAAR